MIDVVEYFFLQGKLHEKILIRKDEERFLASRPPVVTIMGHVDHGKTSLLDFIRKSKVAQGESGGITQHIGAYQVKKNNNLITFIDTPGHEAFTQMRTKGSKITDIVIIVVAADDGPMPQTVECIDHARNANVEIIVAVNKIDKPQANVEKVQSAMSELDLKTVPNGPAQGSVIESYIDPKRGAIATILVQKGQLKVGDFVASKDCYGKVKAIFDEHNRPLKIANPSQPVVILGLNNNPETGSIISVYPSEKEAKEIAKKYEQIERNANFTTTSLVNDKTLNLIIRADAEGSIEAINHSLAQTSLGDHKVNIIRAQSGPITNSDVDLAKASNSIIMGFHVRPQANTREHAKTHNVEIKTYDIIYKMIEDVVSLLKGLQPNVDVEKVQGQAEVRNIFKASKIGTIAGCMVSHGKITSTSRIRIIRDGKIIFTGQISELKRFKDNVKVVNAGFECGITIKNFNDIKEQDIIEAYEIISEKTNQE
uniref:Translation initiation factor IF-2, chloroplastic n=1 Tax=Biomphalaria glabrata TaxID=6526 RepID=A0A2C9JR68_BIOGL